MRDILHCQRALSFERRRRASGPASSCTRLRCVQVSVMAFLEAADMPLFALPDAEGVRLLTSCKRAFTDMMLGALNQILAKPCVRE